jgi:hypothetical protein
MFLSPGVYSYRAARVSQLKGEQLQNTTLTTGAANPGKSPLSSRIKPLLEMSLEALEHLFFDVFDIDEPAPTSDIAVLR